MKNLINIITILLIAMSLQAQVAGPKPPVTAPVRTVSEYNLSAGLGLNGYDPLSYFKEGGAKAKLGDVKITLDYLGVKYNFSSLANLNLFKLKPAKYEPTYGGYCAFAMASGSKVDIDPTLFTINGNRAHFFVSKRAKQNFDAKVKEFEINADKFWKQISGESPRI